MVCHWICRMSVTTMGKLTSLVCKKLDFLVLTPNLVFTTEKRRNLHQLPIPQITIIRIISVTEQMILSTDLKVDEVI